MSKQQPTLFSFFKNQTNNEVQKNGSSNSKVLGTECNEFKAFDLVWAKLDGYPWWPAIVFEHPVEKIISKNKTINVQFFEDPPTRGWVKSVFVKKYGSPESSGIKCYKDTLWLKAKAEADQICSLPIEERAALIVAVEPSDDEDAESISYTDDETDACKENVDINNICGVKRSGEGGGAGAPSPKKRRVILRESDDDSEDEYKPNKSGDQESDDSISSGVAEDEISDIELEEVSEVDSPVKTPKPQKGTRRDSKGNVSFTPKQPSASIQQSPRVSATTKSRLSSFSAASPATLKASSLGEREEWPFMKLVWLKPENLRDSNRRPLNHPDYDARTIFVTDDFLAKQTPAMRQWWEIKRDHFDTVLFFKMGKFYELFHMDAILSIQELGLLMMKGEQAHTGFPEISFGRYSSLLVEKGYKVARVEQVETPEMMEKRCKNISRPSKFDKVVKRELCQVTSLGTRVPSVLDSEAVDDEPRYLLSITETEMDGPGGRRVFGACFVDASIGTFHLAQFEDDRHSSRLRTLLAHFPPCQIVSEKSRLTSATIVLLKSLVPSGLIDSLIPEKQFWSSTKTLSFFSESSFFKNPEGEAQVPPIIKDMLDTGDNLGRTCDEKYELCLRSLGGLIWYLTECRVEQDLLTRNTFELYSPPDVQLIDSGESTNRLGSGTHMIVDGVTLRNLEVFENSLDGSTEGTLFQTINFCCTSFGKRLLRHWVCRPLRSVAAIESRLDAIEDFRANPDLVATVQPLMKAIPDLEKLLTKIHCLGLTRDSEHPDSRAILYEACQYSQRKVSDFLSVLDGFRTALEVFNAFKELLPKLKSSLLKKVVLLNGEEDRLSDMQKSLDFFVSSFDHAEAKREGRIIPNHGVDSEYDESIDLIQQTNQELDSYLKDQCKHFGAKVTYWGNDRKRYQLEVPDQASRKAGSDYELVSQRKGFKRFWTEETREFLVRTISAEEKRDLALRDVARRLFSKFDECHATWKCAVDCLSAVDVLMSLSEFSSRMDSTRPQVVASSEGEKPFVEILDGRHPCSLELFNGGDFIPNDVILGLSGEENASQASLVLVTGPNMGGKSTLMRQTALLCILSQIGSFVPARKCRLSAVDWIFTRLGASDRIFEGESTFYVELAETASIVRHATRNSLVIVDELGRGTATYDGMAIAHSVVEELSRIGARTLFSTHYHSLVNCFASSDAVSLGHMACIVEGNESQDDASQETVTFLYKFVGGACPKSYGFNAARLARLPEQVIKRANEKSVELEANRHRLDLFKRLSGAGIQENEHEPPTRTDYCRDLDFRNIVNKLKILKNV